MSLTSLFHVAFLSVLSIAVSVIGELVSIRYVYSNEAYKSALQKVQNNAKKIEDLETRPVPASQAKSREKTLQQMKSAQVVDQQAVNGLRLRATFAGSVLSMLVLYALSYAYDGVTVLRLPLEPFSLFTAMTHRGAAGTDMRDAGYLFVFVVVSMIVRPLIPKLLGSEQPVVKGGSFMDMMPTQ